ncbi:high-potential iron-sulfur protein [Undibacterium macrobrachii]|uniref:High-potential iron-sulfur protein n=1 Tax=Undibacterium macrobrachii TaxID=1119058 RepID=A0ABQ2XJ52_9BURK|nr:high-potential iron-sulfur protein [Undibacterium macrobrachii]GGX18454.1 high-potential iron-sulfur protein [Undibacterium macrobrachii]
MMKSRRQFLIQAVPAALGLGAALKVNAQANRVDEAAPGSVALGYKHDASKVDTKKFPAYAAGKNCANCMLYQGKATDAWANCAALGNKQVAAKGWCMAWAKKA